MASSADMQVVVYHGEFPIASLKYEASSSLFNLVSWQFFYLRMSSESEKWERVYSTASN